MEGEVSSNMDNKIKNKLNIDDIILKLIMLMLVLAPLFRGLFFEQERAYFHIASFVLALVYMIAKLRTNEFKLIRSKSDLFAFLLMLIYIVSISYAVDKRAAIIEAIKYVNYFVIYMLIRNLAKTKKEHNIVINSLLFGGFIVTMIGILAAVGMVEYNGAVMGNRISSTFQYPNALASYLLALYVITIGKSLVTNNKKLRLVYLNLANLFMFTFILTYSRGMWLIYPIILVIYFAFINREYKLRTIKYNVVTNIISVPSAFLFASKMQEQNPVKLIGILLISMGLVTIIAMISFKFEKLIDKISLKKVVTITILIVIISFWGVFFVLTSTEPVLLENNTEKNKWTSFGRELYSLDLSDKYTLEFECESKNEENKPYIGRVQILAADTENKILGNVLDYYINEIDGEEIKHETNTKFIKKLKYNIEVQIKEADFNINEIDSLKIYFQNYYANTYIKIKKAAILNYSGQIVENIKLKHKYIPEDIAKRFESIHLKNTSADSRVLFQKDALKIIKQNFIMGTGGGGWKTLYRKEQSYNYASLEAHNYYIQQFIEVGFLGVLIFISFTIFLFKDSYKIYKKISKHTIKEYNFIDYCIINKSLIVAIISILMHASLDFDLSICAFTMILFGILGLVSVDFYATNIFKLKLKNFNLMKIINISNISIIFISLTIVVSIKVGSINAKIASKIFENDMDKSLYKLELASHFDFFNVDYKKDLSKIYLEKFKETKDDKYLDKSQVLMKKSIDISKYNFDTLKTAGYYYLSLGNIEKGLDLVDRLVEIQPLNIEAYKVKCDAYLYAFSYYINNLNDRSKAKEIIEYAYETINKELERAKLKTIRPLKLDKELIYKLGFIRFNSDNLNNKVNYMIPKNYRLKIAYYFDVDLNSDGKLDYIGIFNQANGKISYEKKNNGIRIINNGEGYGYLYTNLVDLEPNREYNINVKLSGKIKPENVDIYIYSPKSRKTIQGQFKLEDIKLNPFNYSLNFKTTNDLGSENFIRIIYKGDKFEYLDIYEMSLFMR